MGRVTDLADDPRLAVADISKEEFVGQFVPGSFLPTPGDRFIEATGRQHFEDLPVHQTLGAVKGYSLRYKPGHSSIQVFLLSGSAVVGFYRLADQIVLHSMHNDMRLAAELILAAYTQQPWRAPKRVLSAKWRPAFEMAWDLVAKLIEDAKAPEPEQRAAPAGPAWGAPPPDLRIEMPEPLRPADQVGGPREVVVLELPELNLSELELALPQVPAPPPAPASATATSTAPLSGTPTSSVPASPPAAPQRTAPQPPSPASPAGQQDRVIRPGKLSPDGKPLTSFQIAALELPPLDKRESS